MYSATTLLDSVTPDGVRLTTMEVVFPRFILAEFNTHRVFSRNSASSRAIPTEKLIAQVRERPFVPETFNKRVKGMGVGPPIKDQAKARDQWLWAAEQAATAAEILMTLDCDKSRANRLLEPFMWHTVIVTGTEWDNFWALRCSPKAQPEMELVALLMRDNFEQSAPWTLDYGEWHLPLTSVDFPFDEEPDWDYWKKISVGRCARVSYLTHDGVRDHQKDIELHDSLLSNGHMSPFEHVAQATPAHYGMGQYMSGNFRKGWIQYRKEIPGEAVFDADL